MLGRIRLPLQLRHGGQGARFNKIAVSRVLPGAILIVVLWSSHVLLRPPHGVSLKEWQKLVWLSSTLPSVFLALAALF